MIKTYLKKCILSVTGVPVEWMKYYFNQAKRFYNNSSASLSEKDVEWIVTKIKVLTHGLDKGIHMPEPRKGFGREKSTILVEYLKKYLEFGKFDYEYDAYLDAVEVLHKYCEAKDLYDLDVSSIDLEEFEIDYSKATKRLSETGSFNCLNETESFDFKKFASSRHSIRYFKPSYKIDQGVFEKAIKIARLCPSACNRQSSRVMLINDEGLSKKILEIQGGSKGFKNADNCILVMSDLNSYWYNGEMNTSFIDAGIFVMNLIYALKYYGIESCPLIWDDNTYRRQVLDEIIQIPKNYFIMCVLAVGEADAKAKALLSPRKDIDEIIIKVRRK